MKDVYSSITVPLVFLLPNRQINDNRNQGKYLISLVISDLKWILTNANRLQTKLSYIQDHIVIRAIMLKISDFLETIF